MTEPRLSDLGERCIISELLWPRYGENSPHYGDDCAVLPLGAHPGSHLVLTTDPCPPPMAGHLGFSDPFYRGWLLATINLSDLAAAGASPLGLLTSLQLPSDTTVRAFERLLDGIDECCAQAETRVLGGNLKEAANLDVAGTAVGVCDTPPLTRLGAQVGDVVVVLGEFGSFWAGVLGVQRGFLEMDVDEPLLRNVLTPRPKVATGLAARRAGLLTACIDNSDGLYPSLLQLAQASNVRLVVEADPVGFSDGVTRVARRLDTEPLRLAMGWGDWQLVGTCAPESLDALGQVVEHTGTELHRLGRVEDGAGVTAEVAGRSGPLMPLDSQRFAPDSWFSVGLDAYCEFLLNSPLLQEQ